MRIERVDEKTVKCFLSNEEMEEYEIDYKDFVTRSDKAREVVQEIIAQAEVEVGYHPPRFAFDLQIMMVPNQGLVLVFSDKDPDMKEGELLMECLKEMKKILQNNIAQPVAASESAKDAKIKNQQAPDFAVFEFTNLRDVMEYCRMLPGNLRVDSALYEMENSYYLVLQKGHASYARFSRACVQSLEFGKLYSAEADRLIQLREHGECLIAEKAVRKLRFI